VVLHGTHAPSQMAPKLGSGESEEASEDASAASAAGSEFEPQALSRTGVTEYARHSRSTAE
jgi:hypothetical protein